MANTIDIWPAVNPLTRNTVADGAAIQRATIQPLVDRTDKLLDSQIGNFLMSKLGSREAVETLIDKGTLILLPFSDIRGYDTSGMNCGVYITEA